MNTAMSSHPAATRRWNGPTLGASLALGPALLVIICFQVLPLLTLLRYSFNRFTPTELMTEAFTLENYVRFLVEPYFQEVLLTTLGLSLLCTLSALVLGYPVAYFLARTQSRFKSLMLIIILFPLLIGNVVRAAGWMAFLGRGGIMNYVLLQTGIISEPLELLFTPLAVYMGMLGVTLPFMILTLQGVLENIDSNLISAAQNLGASPATSFRRVVLPLSMPGVAAGSVLVFMLSMNAYATPVLLGGSSFKMMSPILYSQISVASNWPFGSALAFILILVTLIATLASTYLLSRQAQVLR